MGWRDKLLSVLHEDCWRSLSDPFHAEVQEDSDMASDDKYLKLAMQSLIKALIGNSVLTKADTEQASQYLEKVDAPRGLSKGIKPIDADDIEAQVKANGSL